MSYQIPKQLTRYSNKFLVGTFKQDATGAAFIVLAIVFFRFLPFPARANLVLAGLALFAGALFLLLKLDEKLAERLAFSKRGINLSYYDAGMGRFVDVAKVANNAAFLKDGTALAVLKVTPIDFAILSDDEQEEVVGKYRAFLRSLFYPIQICSRSVEINLGAWLRNCEAKIKQSPLPNRQLNLAQFGLLKDWIGSVVDQSTIRNRVFYVAIPYYPSFQNLSFLASLKQFASSLLGKAVAASLSEADVKKSLKELDDLAEDYEEKLGETGVGVERLGNDELIGLFSSYFNDVAGVDTSFLSPIMWRGGENVV